MGGGGGVSIPGTFRIATDRTVCQCIFTHLLLFSIYFCGELMLFSSCCFLYFLNSLESGIWYIFLNATISGLCNSRSSYWIPSWRCSLILFVTSNWSCWLVLLCGVTSCPFYFIGGCAVVHCKIGICNQSASFHTGSLAGEYVALTGEKLNGTDMIALGLATHYSMSGVRFFLLYVSCLKSRYFYCGILWTFYVWFFGQHLDLIDERLAKLVTDDPSVIDSSLAQYGDMVYPDKKSIVHR
jgi:hypothetical protein